MRQALGQPAGTNEGERTLENLVSGPVVPNAETPLPIFPRHSFTHKHISNQPRFEYAIQKLTKKPME